MREIKFRGLRDDGIWVYGDLTQDSDLEQVYISGHEYYANGEGLQRDSFTYEVDDETVGQYTGLKDCNDTEIYEGDIVERRYIDKARNKKIKNKYLVSFEDGHFKARYRGRPIKITMLLYFLVDETPNQCTVIGNIYKNPELLEVV